MRTGSEGGLICDAEKGLKHVCLLDGLEHTCLLDGLEHVYLLVTGRVRRRQEEEQVAH